MKDGHTNPAIFKYCSHPTTPLLYFNLVLERSIAMPPSNIDHITIPAPEGYFKPLVEWYKTALSPLRYKEIMQFPGIVGLGNEFPDFWIAQKETNIPSGLHFAFSAPSTLMSFIDDLLRHLIYSLTDLPQTAQLSMLSTK